MRTLLALALALPLAAADPWSESYRLEGQKQYAQAAQVLAPLADTHELAQLRRAYLAYLQARHGEALDGYARALQMNPRSVDALLGMTLPLMAQQRWAEAAASCRRALELAPWNYTACVRLLACQEAQGQWKELGDWARELSVRYPTDATAWVYLGRAEVRQGRVAEAATAYARVLELVPGHKEAAEQVRRAQ